METIKDLSTGGERPFFGSRGLRLQRVTVTDGESALKECTNIDAIDCTFIGLYPFWHVNRLYIDHCRFAPEARAGLWYSSNLIMRDTVTESPKMFRDMSHLDLKNVTMNNAEEAFWRCVDVKAEHLEVNGGMYPFMLSRGVKLDYFKSDCKYMFQYARDIEIRHADLRTKDAFWESENVTVYDSRISGQYLGWHSVNLHLVRCHISGTQPLCYCRGLVLEDCTFDADADLAFEYSDVRATVLSPITSVKNPSSGMIRARSIGEVIVDGYAKSPAGCRIITDVPR